MPHLEWITNFKCHLLQSISDADIYELQYHLRPRKEGASGHIDGLHCSFILTFFAVDILNFRADTWRSLLNLSIWGDAVRRGVAAASAR
jgi:hypothetical protein